MSLGSTSPAAPGSRGNGPAAGRWVIVTAVALAMGSLIYFWWTSRAKPVAAPPSPTVESDVAGRSHRPKRQPGELPALDVSDAAVREAVGVLSHNPLFERLLATKDVVRTAAIAVEQIGDGKTPATPLSPIRPDGHLSILGVDSGRLSIASYERWNAATASLTGVRPNEAAQCYVNIKELFDAAYREIGHPNGNFDTAIVRAIQELRDTPDPPTEPILVQRSGYVEHEDPALAALPPVQKQFLLIGPTNRAQILAWLTQFANALDLKID